MDGNNNNNNIYIFLVLCNNLFQLQQVVDYFSQKKGWYFHLPFSWKDVFLEKIFLVTPREAFDRHRRGLYGAFYENGKSNGLAIALQQISVSGIAINGATML